MSCRWGYQEPSRPLGVPLSAPSCARGERWIAYLLPDWTSLDDNQTKKRYREELLSPANLSGARTHTSRYTLPIKLRWFVVGQ